MYLLYSLLLFVGILILLPRFLLDAARHGKYAAGFRERLGGVAPLTFEETSGRAVIWLHCVSVGEAQAARPLVKLLRARFPDHALVVSTTTLTGQRIACEIFKNDAARVFYFPFDFAFSVRRALDSIKPSVVLIMETEIWFRFLRECRRREIPVAIVNGRLSEKSFRNYRRLGAIIRRVLQNVSLAVMQSEADAARIRALGLDDARIRVSGNIKYDLNDATAENQSLADELRARFQLDGARPVILAASTHANEERILLYAFWRLCEEHGLVKQNQKIIEENMKRGLPPACFCIDPNRHLRFNKINQPRLIIAPRHPERFNEVAELIAPAFPRWARRSSQPSEGDKNADVVLLDSIGELRAVYPLAEIVFVGGSLVPVGGHNILEPASAGRATIVGSHTHNFAQIVGDFLARGALIQLPETKDESEAADLLAREVFELLTDDARRDELGQNARRALDENRGATARTVDFIAPLLKEIQPQTKADDGDKNQLERLNLN